MPDIIPEMPDIKRHAIVPYTNEQMFHLVNEVEEYSQFVPWCCASRVLSREEDEVCAELSFARAGLQKSFTTKNRLQPHKMIEIRLVNGPFHLLEGLWRFDGTDNGRCQVMLDLEFEFSHKLIGLAFGPIFYQIADMLVDVFCKRAQVV